MEIVKHRENETADYYQQRLYDELGYNNAREIWNSFRNNEKNLLEIKIRKIMGTKSEDNILKLVDALWKHRTDDGELFVSIILVLSANYEKYKNHLDSARGSLQYSRHPVFRVRKCLDNLDHECCMIFVDENARIYTSWKQFLENNLLPKAVIIAPKRGIYRWENQNVLLEVRETPACSTIATAIEIADKITTIVSLGSTGVIIAGIWYNRLTPLVAGAVVVGTTCTAYSFFRSFFNLRDRINHQQSISLKDPEARGNWLGVVGSLGGIVAGAATRTLSNFARNGKHIGTALNATTNFANVSTIVTNACGVLHGSHAIFRRNDKSSISKLEQLQLATSIFLLTHSVCTFQTANHIVEKTQKATIAKYQDDLSKKLRKFFMRMCNETLRNDEGSKTGIIRFIQSPGNKMELRDALKMYRKGNRNNEPIYQWFGKNGDIRFSFD